jgi:LPS export ABC transporter protein LptC
MKKIIFILTILSLTLLGISFKAEYLNEFLKVPYNSLFLEASTQEPDQTISDFNFSGYGEKGKRTWEVAAKSADIFGDKVELEFIIAKVFGETDNLTLTADEGNFDKLKGKMHLEKNVIATTSSGAKLTTNSLNWDQTTQIITSADVVNVQKENINTQGQGLEALPALNRVILAEDVTVKINPISEKKDSGPPDKPKLPTTVTCDGPLEINYEKRVAIFHNNVTIKDIEGEMSSNKMEVFFASSEGTQEKQEDLLNSDMKVLRIEKVRASGDVRITRDGNTSFSEEAIYTPGDKKLILTGSPKLIIYPEGGLE